MCHHVERKVPSIGFRILEAIEIVSGNSEAFGKNPEASASLQSPFKVAGTF